MPQEEAPLTICTDAVDRLVDDVVRAASATSLARVVIDGRSGAGKTTAAGRIANDIGARLVSLDEFYPGWAGLADGGRIAGEIVHAHASGAWGRYRRWDWARLGWRRESEQVDPSRPLVVEGCGALTAPTARQATVSVWMNGDAHARYDIAIARDGDGFRAHWDEWARQEEAHLRRHDPRALADIAVDVC